MSMPTLQDIEKAVRSGWGVEICEDPADVPAWTEDNPARGQCGPTALVVHDLLGGELCVAEVHLIDGTQRGFHWWNRLPDGTELDLTRSQFAPDEVLQRSRVLARPRGPMKRGEAQYLLLRSRVFAALGLSEPSPHALSQSEAAASLRTAASSTPIGASAPAPQLAL